jgi:hypothetical protein
MAYVFVADRYLAPIQAAEFTAPSPGPATPIAPRPDGVNVRFAKQGVIVQALAANTAAVYVGGRGVLTTTGIELSPGDSVLLPLGDPSMIFAVGAAANQKLHVVWT